MKKRAGKDRSENILRTAAAGRRSKLYRWLMENHDAFKSTLAAAGQPDWKALSVAFGKEGLTDRLGKAPTPEGARQTWFAVRQAVAKSPGLAGSPPVVVSPSRPVIGAGERQPAPLQSSPLPAAALSPATVVDPIAPRRRMRFQSARALAPGEAPKDDGSKLPRPLHPNLKIED
jgi:hypothetical protein